MKSQPQASRAWALWAEPAIILLLSPAFLFPTPKRAVIFLGLPFVFLLHFGISRRFAEFTPALLPVASLLVMVLVSLYATYDLQQSLPKVAGMLLGTAAFISIANSIVTRHRVSMMIAVFLSGGITLACVGLLGTQWFARVPLLGKITVHIPAVIRGLKGAEEGFQPNGVAGGLILFIPLQIALAFRLQHNRTTDRSMKRIFVALVVSILATGGVVVLTQSRGGWLGLGVGLLLLLAWSSRPGKWIAGIVVFVGIATMIWMGPRKIGDSLMTGIGATTGVGSSIDGRLELWNRAIYGISDFPFTGMGMNTFRKVVHVLYPLFLSAPETDIAHCHNQILQTGLDLGIPGVTAYAALLAAAITMGFFIWRRSKDPWFRITAQGIVCGLVAQQVFGITDAIALGAKIGIFFWIGLGLLAAMFRLTTLSCEDHVLLSKS